MRQRYLTAAVVIPLFSIVIEFLHHSVVSAIVAIATLIALEEYSSMQRKRGFVPERYSLWLSVICLMIGAGMGLQRWMIAGITLGVIVLFLGALARRQTPAENMVTFPVTAFAFLLSYLTAHLILLRTIDPVNPELGKDLLFYLFAVVWLGDTAAYHIGKKYGKHKLAPVLSPKKTIEGFIACLFGSLAISFMFSFYLNLKIPPLHLAILGIILPLAGQLGDLVESIFKRGVEIKDSSSIIPGHGGMFDRFDSLFLSAPLLYAYCKLILGY